MHPKQRNTARYAGLFFAIALLVSSTPAGAVTATNSNATNHNTNAKTVAPVVPEKDTALEAELNEAKPLEADGEHAEEEKTGVLGTLGVNWKLLIAQLVNFAIVLFVLWKWVFGPVARGLENRTKKIEQSLEDATTITKEKEEFQVWKTKEMSSARAEAAAIVTEAKKEAEEVKNKILAQTRTEQEKVVEQAKAQLESEKDKALGEIKGEIATLVVAATQKILQEKLDPVKDKDLIKQSLKNI